MKSKTGKNTRETLTLKYGWKFRLADAPEMALPDFDDSGWETVRVPHDWAIEGPFSRENDIHVTAIIQDGQRKSLYHTGRTGGLPHAGKAWYRLKFSLPKDICSKRVRIEFDGIMSHSRVYCNGKYVDTWPYGYASFAFDLTDFIKQGDNILAVSVDNKPLASRWYPGAGIYRKVRLVIMNPVHVSLWGTCVTTKPLNEKTAQVDIKTTVENHTGKRQKVTVETTVIGPVGKKHASSSETRTILKSGVILQKIRINSPVLWSVDSPKLHTVLTTLKTGGKKTDYHETLFGIRYLKFDAGQGLLLNGEKMRFKGVCMHHDLGPLGTAVNAEALKRQLSMLKDMGCNAIRTSHNPPAPELLDLADNMGFLVIDEAFDEWRMPKCKNGYNILFDGWAKKDLLAMIRRDRNHPSVIMWSIGNEVPEQDVSSGAKTAAFLHNICKKEDPSRPTTAAFNSPDNAIKNGLAEIVDIPGWNYTPNSYAAYKAKLPGKPMYGSETGSCISTRGVYYFPAEEERNPKRKTLQVSSYDLACASWANLPDTDFRSIDENPFIMGEFTWTGFDYLGEPTPYYEEWPSRSSYFGIIDLAGIPKDRFYLYRSRWTEKETLHILPHWTWPGREGELTPVHCYSRWDTVELFVNGVSQGVRSKHHKNMVNRYRLVWSGVIYRPGELKAIAYDNDGHPVKETAVRTSGKPAGIQLTADRKEIRADGDGMAFFNVDIIDSKGTLCPGADNLVRFKINGPAEIAGLDNGNPASTEPFHADYRKAFNGSCVLYLRSLKGKKGRILVTAESAGLKKAEAVLSAR
ncbi:MAG: DUF4982 domain-containing protein [Candidatus Omnitrophica bacterium]|nr:DUF4982 domain-containing protein [Candidatus Omnitrophota bacterium]